MKLRNAASATLLVALGVGSAATRAADAPPQHHVRGTISAITGNAVTIATTGGPVVVTISAKTAYAGVVPGAASEITPGTFIGAANVPGDGYARALAVVVFPKSQAGTDQGDYLWDLPAGGRHKSTMTNGTVAAPKAPSMSDSIVSVANSMPKMITLTYKGGTKVIAIAGGTPIVRIVPASRANLIPGVHVVAFRPIRPRRS